LTDYDVIRNETVIRRNDQISGTMDDLVSRAKHGDQDAFGLIYREYVQSIYKYIYIRVNNDTKQAEDLTQEVFLKALNNLDSYRFRGKPFGSWLFRIAHNLVIDYYRKPGNGNITSMTESTIIISEDDPVASFEHSSEMDEVKRAIDKLPAQQKEIITMRFTNGLSVAETADALGKTKGTVKKLQHVALVKLKKLMKR